MWLDSQNISEQSDQLGDAERRAVTKYKWELMDRFPKTQAVVTAARELTASEYRISFSGYAALQQIEQLTDLLERLPESESLLRVKLLARLVAAQLPLDVEAAYKTLNALQLAAHAADDETARAYALVASNVCDLATRNPVQRVADTQNALEICVRTGEGQLVPMALFLKLDALLQTGNIDAIDRELSAKTTSLKQFHQLLDGRHATWSRCMRATLDGRLQEAEELIDLGFARAEAANDADSHIVRVGQLAIIRWLQGQVDEVEPYLLQARQAFPHETIWAAGVAWIWNHQGRSTAAKGMLESIGPIGELPRDRHWLAGLAILGEVVSKLGPSEVAEEIYEVLLPYENQLAPIGLGVTTWGPVSRCLAQLAHRLARYEAAEKHYRDAINLCSALGAQVWLAQSQMGLAGVLYDRRQNLQKVRDLAEQSVRAAEHLGLQTTELQARKLLERLDGSPTTAQARIASESRIDGRPRIEVLSPFKVYDAAGERVVWRSHKAAQLLKILVARRGVPIPREQVLEHLWPNEDQSQLGNRFAVAISTVRSALDPQKQHARDEFVRLTPHSVSLNLTYSDIDCEAFLEKAHRVNDDTSIAELSEIVGAYDSGFLPDEPYVSWAEPLRREVDVTFSAVGHRLGRLLLATNDNTAAAELYRKLIEIDEYDQTAHEGLIAALQAQGAHGRALEARQRARSAFEELGIEFPDD